MNAFYPDPCQSQKCPSLEEIHSHLIYSLSYGCFNNHMAPDNSEIKWGSDMMVLSFL